jgi:hypothetical protein
MSNKFDELTKGLAQSVTRRAALKKFGVGLAGMALACLGLGNQAHAQAPAAWLTCKTYRDCPPGMVCFFATCRSFRFP